MSPTASLDSFSKVVFFPSCHSLKKASESIGILTHYRDSDKLVKSEPRRLSPKKAFGSTKDP
jgi:hypothetical protein